MKLGIKKKVFSFLEKNLSEEHYMCFRELHGWLVTHLFDRGKVNWHGYFLSRKKNNEKYYVFRVSSSVAPFAAWRMFLLSCDWAVKKGYTPLIDVECNDRYYDIKTDLGKENIWEDVFEQKIPVKDIYIKDWVWVEYVGMRMSDRNTCKELNGEEDDNQIHMVEDNWRYYYAKINKISQQNVCFRKDIIEEFENKYGSFFEDSSFVLGVCMREEFSKEWLAHMPEGSRVREIYEQHPLGPSVQEIINIIQRQSEKWGCKKIFVTTIFRDTIEKFHHVFGENVIYIDRERREFKTYVDEVVKAGEAEENDYIENREREREKERRTNFTYAEEVIGLSRCNYFIGAPCSATIAAMTINGGMYEDIYLLPDYNSSILY